jgi:hypothetical protein
MIAMNETNGTPITVAIGDATLHAHLWDNATARDLMSLLPLTLTFNDYNRVEKLSRLPRALSLQGMPRGAGAAPADIGYYAPANDLVLYYRDVGYFPGIMLVGHFDDNVDVIARQTGEFTARIEQAD